MNWSDSWSLIGKAGDIIKSLFRNKKADEVYLWAAPWIYLLLAPLVCLALEMGSEQVMSFLAERIGNGDLENTPEWVVSFVDEVLSLATMLIAWVLSILLSNHVVQKLEKAVELRKYTVYEKIEHHYYLKESCVPYRNLFRFLFSNGTLDVFVILVLALMNNLAGQANLEIAVLPDVLGHLVVWGELKWEYLSGDTLLEARKAHTSRIPERRFPVDIMHLKIGASLGSALLGEMAYSQDKLCRNREFGIKPPRFYSDLFHALLREKNVLVENCFYRKWDSALFIPLNALLLRDKKVVIFVGATMDPGALHRWLESRFNKMIVMKKAWRICVWDETVRDFDIAVVPYGRIPGFVRQTKASKFKACGIVQIVFEPARGMSEIRYSLESYADYMRDRKIPVTWCFADRHIDGLLDYLSHAVRAKITKLETEAHNCENIYLCMSKFKDNSMAAEWWKQGYVNSSAVVAFRELLKNHEDRIYFVSEQAFAVQDFWLRMKSLVPQLSVDAANGYELHFCTCLWDLDKEDIEDIDDSDENEEREDKEKSQEKRIILTDDEHSNFYDLYWYLLQCGQKFNASFVFADHYLLFDFMMESEREQMHKKEAVPVWYPIYQDTERNRILKIIRKATELFPRTESVIITEAEVRQLFPEWRDAGGSEIGTRLNDCTRRYWSDGDAFEYMPGYYLLSQEFLRRYAWLWQEVRFVDETRNDLCIGNMLYCHFYQRWLDGQLISRDGYCYRVGRRRKGQSGKIIPLQRSQCFWNRKRIYRQCREYRVRNVEAYATENIKQVILAERCTATVSVNTSGWYVQEWDRTTTEISRNCRVPQRVYRNRNILFLHFIEPEAGEVELQEPQNSGEFLEFLAEWMEETSRTFYPYHYPYNVI